MKIVFLTITSRYPSWLQEVAEDYSAKISYWFKTEVTNLSTKTAGRDSKEHKLKAEGDKILGFLESSDFVVLCDEKGKEFSSLSFAKNLEAIMQRGKRRLVFVIGGAYGVTAEVRARADQVLSLSKLTFNHHVAIATILEQVYRGFTIVKGIKYHNE